MVHAIDIVFPPVRPFRSDMISTPGNVPAVYLRVGLQRHAVRVRLTCVTPRRRGVVVVEHFLLPPLRVFLTAMSVEDGPAELCLEVSDALGTHADYFGSHPAIALKHVVRFRCVCNFVTDRK